MPGTQKKTTSVLPRSAENSISAWPVSRRAAPALSRSPVSTGLHEWALLDALETFPGIRTGHESDGTDLEQYSSKADEQVALERAD
jgi:hypothetical protein